LFDRSVKKTEKAASKTRRHPKVTEDETFSKKFEGKDLCEDWCTITEGYGDLLDQVTLA